MTGGGCCVGDAKCVLEPGRRVLVLGWAQAKGDEKTMGSLPAGRMRPTSTSAESAWAGQHVSSAWWAPGRCGPSCSALRRPRRRAPSSALCLRPRSGTCAGRIDKRKTSARAQARAGRLAEAGASTRRRLLPQGSLATKASPAQATTSVASLPPGSTAQSPRRRSRCADCASRPG